MPALHLSVYPGLCLPESDNNALAPRFLRFGSDVQLSPALPMAEPSKVGLWSAQVGDVAGDGNLLQAIRTYAGGPLRFMGGRARRLRPDMSDFQRNGQDL